MSTTIENPPEEPDKKQPPKTNIDFMNIIKDIPETSKFTWVFDPSTGNCIISQKISEYMNVTIAIVVINGTLGLTKEHARLILNAMCEGIDSSTFNVQDLNKNK